MKFNTLRIATFNVNDHKQHIITYIEINTGQSICHKELQI